jgi:hypothetical protein
VAESRRTAVAVLALGGALALLGQLASPVAVPLYDGLVVQEPYRFLSPVAGQAGAPTSFSTDKPIQGGVSASFVAATTENPPQAQLIALPGAFVVTATTTTMKISIEPVPGPPTPPPIGAIQGNVYRFAVTDQAGASLPIAKAGGNPPTITLRGPEGVVEGTIARLGANGWELLTTEHGGALALFSTNPSSLGDFAVIVAGPDATPSIGLLVGAILAVAVPVALVVFLFVRQRRGRQLAAETARARNRIPSKRVAPRPPKGPRRRS